MGTEGGWFRGRMLGWVFSLIRIRAHVIQLKDVCARAKLLQLCLTFCDPMDCSLPGSSVHGILQARILEWVAVQLKGG